MADDTFGLSFAPFAGQQGYGSGGPAGALSPIQEAVQILSLRRPTVTGAAPVSNSLYNAQGLGGAPDFSALIQTLLRQYGQMGPQGTPGQFPVPSGPRALPGTPGGTSFGIPTPPSAPVFPTPPSAPRIDFGNPGPAAPQPPTGMGQGPGAAPMGGQPTLSDVRPGRAQY